MIIGQLICLKFFSPSFLFFSNLLFSDSEGQGFILVYSIASRSTFERLEKFHHFKIIMLVGNKCDKTYEREVSKEEGAALARQFGCKFIETSAMTAQNVEGLFINLVRSLRQTQPPVKKEKSYVGRFLHWAF